MADKIFVSSESTLEELGIGSMEIIEIIFFLERELMVKLPSEVLTQGNLESVESLARFAAGLLNEE